MLGFGRVAAGPIRLSIDPRGAGMQWPSQGGYHGSIQRVRQVRTGRSCRDAAWCGVPRTQKGMLYE